MVAAPNITPIDTQAHDLLKALYAPFPAEDHEVRELRKTKSGKVQWSVYIRREAITHRLDSLLPFEWEFKTNEPRREAEYVSVKGSLIIKGVTRDNNGGGRPKGKAMTEDVEKAAMTDCFKRCASSWGIGLYLQNAPDIYTDGYEESDWDTMRQREREALDKVAKWLAPKPDKPQRRIPPPENVDTSTGEIVDKPATTKGGKPLTLRQQLVRVEHPYYAGNQIHLKNAIEALYRQEIINDRMPFDTAKMLLMTLANLRENNMESADAIAEVRRIANEAQKGSE